MCLLLPVRHLQAEIGPPFPQRYGDEVVTATLRAEAKTEQAEAAEGGRRGCVCCRVYCMSQQLRTGTVYLCVYVSLCVLFLCARVHAHANPCARLCESM